MHSLVDPLQEERLKYLGVMRRALPVTRMVDYGVPLGDAVTVHAWTAEDAPMTWDEACEHLAQRHRRVAAQAEQDGHRATASAAWRSASALLHCSQLAFNADQPRKTALYEEAHEALEHHARLSGDLAAITLPTALGDVHGWVVRPAGEPARAAVLVIGGLSGWGPAYLDMGRALAARGMLAILGEGPGQGLTRMRGGLHLSADTLPAFQAFLDHARDLAACRLGVWGNSFGGLLAAHVATADERVQAVCINGAVAAPATPTFRTAREQMQAVFGVQRDDAIDACLRGLAIRPEACRTVGAVLVVEGGRDPLVALGEQAPFLELAAPGLGRTLTWEDGEHTIYNHAQERNGLVGDWFAGQLLAPG